MKRLFLKSLKCLKIDRNCGVNRNQNLIPRGRSRARRCYRKYSPAPERPRCDQRERENEVAVCEMARTSLKTVPLPSLPLSLLLCSHLEAHHSPIRSPIPSNSAPCRLPAKPAALSFTGTVVCLITVSLHNNSCLIREERKTASPLLSGVFMWG